MAQADLRVDAEVWALVRTGRVRVIIMLQVPEAADEGQRADAIGRAQDAVLSRLPQSTCVWCQASIPMPALEIDAVALRSLEMMIDVVVGVKLDRAVKPE